MISAHTTSHWAMACVLALAAFSPLPARAQGGGAQAASYTPQRVAVPRAAPYVRPDGTIYIVGDDAMDETMAKLDALFARTHPGFRFTTLLKGSSTGVGGLTAGVSAMAPMGRPGWPDALSAFKEVYGYAPLDVHIGYDSFSHPGHKNPPALYVNARNPLAGLTAEQATRIFTAGAKGGDITTWGQLGLKGAWAHRRIHLYGLRDDGGFATSLRESKMGKHPFSPRYEALDKPEEVIAAVSQDPFGVALMGFYDPEKAPQAKLVPLAAREGAPFVAPTYENVEAGLYPYASDLRIYVNRRPGAPLDPFLKEYLRMVLSPQGQAIVAEGRDNEQGFVPLDPQAVRAELAKLD
jgi:phosphate transport system substrate-binding protein